MTVPLLNTYMAWVKGVGPDEGACLIFARTAREARKIAWPILAGWWGADCWTSTRTRRLCNMPWLYKEADAAKLAAGVAHAIECPTCCDHCELWGLEDPENCCDDKGLS